MFVSALTNRAQRHNHVNVHGRAPDVHPTGGSGAESGDMAVRESLGAIQNRVRVHDGVGVHDAMG